MSDFSEILKRERKKKGLSKADLARKLDIPYTTYQNYENGREPKIDVIKAISIELNIDPSVFFDLENHSTIYDHVYNPNYHDEIEDILLFDSQKIFKLKESFEMHHEDMEDRYMNLHFMFDNFYKELKKFRNDYFATVDESKLHPTYIKMNDIIERSLEDAEYHYQKTIYESQFMDEETIKTFKLEHPDYKIQIINKIIFDKADYYYDNTNQELVDALYQIALEKYFPNK